MIEPCAVRSARGGVAELHGFNVTVAWIENLGGLIQPLPKFLSAFPLRTSP
jgi:hypothetical protein